MRSGVIVIIMLGKLEDIESLVEWTGCLGKGGLIFGLC